MQYIKEITVDLSGEMYFSYITAVQSDENSRFVKITLLSGDVAFVPPEGAIAALRCKKPDGTFTFNDATINKDGTITAELTGNMLATVGNCRCEVTIYDNGSALTSVPFIVKVTPGAVDPDVKSTNEYTALTNALNKVQNAAGVSAAALEEATNAFNKIAEVEANINGHITAAAEATERANAAAAQAVPDQTYNHTSENAQSGIAVAEAVAPIKSDLNKFIKLHVVNDFEIGGISTSGIELEYASWRRTKLLFLEKNKTIKVLTSNHNANAVALYEFTSDGTPVGILLATDYGTTNGLYEYIAERDMYVRASGTEDLNVSMYYDGLSAYNNMFLKSSEKDNIEKNASDIASTNNMIHELNDIEFSKKISLFGKTARSYNYTDQYYQGVSVGFYSPMILNNIKIAVKIDTDDEEVPLYVCLVSKSKEYWSECCEKNNYSRTLQLWLDNMCDDVKEVSYKGKGETEIITIDYNNLITYGKYYYLCVFSKNGVKMYHIFTPNEKQYEENQYGEYIATYKADGLHPVMTSLTNVGFAVNSNQFGLYVEVNQMEYVYDDNNRLIEKYAFLASMFDKVLCIGDSITEIGGNKTYSKLLGKIANWETNSIGKSGFSVSDMEEYLPTTTVDYSNYEAVILILGTNHIRYGTGVRDGLETAETQNNYKAIINSIIEQNPNAKIFCCGLPNLAKSNAYDDYIKQIASSYNKNVFFLDLCNNPFIDLRKKQYHLHAQDDYIHYGKIGRLALANVIFKQIITVMANNEFDFEE